jgi:transposase
MDVTEEVEFTWPSPPNRPEPWLPGGGPGGALRACPRPGAMRGRAPEGEFGWADEGSRVPAAPLGYPTDLTDAEWDAVRRLLPPRKPLGATRKTPMRAVINAIFYRLRSGCAWRMLPHDFPPWRTVYGYFRQWQQDGTWPRISRLQRRLRGESRRPGPSER